VRLIHLFPEPEKWQQALWLAITAQTTEQHRGALWLKSIAKFNALEKGETYCFSGKKAGSSSSRNKDSKRQTINSRAKTSVCKCCCVSLAIWLKNLAGKKNDRGAEGISGRVKFLPLVGLGCPKQAFAKNSDSPHQVILGCIHKGSKENIMNIIGIDVSKNTLDCALINDSNHAKFKFKVVSNYEDGRVKFLPLVGLGCPKQAFAKNSDSPHQVIL
jgi:hypothetical protein